MTAETPYAEVIGDPIAHSKSPLIHAFWLRQLGLEGEYRAIRVSPSDLDEFLQQRRSDPRWRGCNVTMPLKLAAAGMLDEHRSPLHKREPVNLIIRRDGKLLGTNTDVVGIMEPLRAVRRHAAQTLRPAPTGAQTAVVLGSGGVLLSVARVLKSLGYTPVTFVARSEDKVREQLGDELRQWRHLPWGAPLPPCDLLVNATPLGMTGQPELPYDASAVNEGGVVFEMIYDPQITPLLAHARRRRLQIVDGLTMLVAQAAPSFEQLFGVSAPRQQDDALRELLTA